MTVFEAIQARHSYRGPYEDTPVPREALEKIMQAGLAAPSGCNQQTTSLIGVDDPQVLGKLYEVLAPVTSKPAPAMICVLTQRISSYRGRCYAVQDYAAAIENMLLTIVGLGYQSCWYEGQVTDEEGLGRQMARILGVPDAYELVCFLPVGVAKKEVRWPQKKPFAQRAWFNGFEKTEP